MSKSTIKLLVGLTFIADAFIFPNKFIIGPSAFFLAGTLMIAIGW